MEGKLEPWVHFVPLDGPDDVERKLQWCREHQGEAKAIVANSTAFMWQFVVPESERDIVSTILWRYRANVRWVRPEQQQADADEAVNATAP